MVTSRFDRLLLSMQPLQQFFGFNYRHHRAGGNSVSRLVTDFSDDARQLRRDIYFFERLKFTADLDRARPLQLFRPHDAHRDFPVSSGPAVKSVAYQGRD